MMTRKQFGSALAMLALAITIPAAFSEDGGHGGSGGGQKQQRSITLTPTSTGARHGASGTASWRIQGNNQKFKVDFDIQAPNGTVFLINVDGSTVGSATVALGEAEFEIEGEDGNPLPAPLNPVNQIQQVSVISNAGTTVLQGSF